MNTGAEIPNFTQKKTKSGRSRGRPPRHESERLKTIAWYHFLAGDKSPAEMCDWLPFVDIDQATIYRYRRGDISPRDDILNAEDEVFRAARNVYEIGPWQVPLWDAMWGSITPADFRLADRLMPGGEWPKSVMNELFFDDAILARIIGFRDMTARADSVVSDLEAFVAALRVFRSWEMLGHGNIMTLRVLLEGTMALPGARGMLEQYGLIKPLQGWIASQFGKAAALNGEPAYWAPWMNDDGEFARLCLTADMRKLQMRHGLLRQSGSDFDREVITDHVQGDTWH